MGITGLLEQLKSISQNVHISQYRGKKVAIDAQCWLHRGAYSCSKELATGEETTRYISFFLTMVRMLRENGVDSIIAVFDGIPLPSKAETNFKRSSRRTQQRQLAQLAEERGESKIAQTHYQRSVAITFDMVQRLIAALHSAGVHYMIAPYEADAQLAFLSQQMIVDIVITEDSDLLPYGCRTVIFKLDKEGDGIAIEKEHIPLSQPMSFASWTDEQFILFCCLAGCDYLPSLCNIGIKSAHRIVSAHKTLSRVLDHMAFSPAVLEFGGSFATRLQMAVMTFKHQTVYNPFTGQTEPLHPLPPHASSGFTTSAQTTSACLLLGGISGTVSRAARAVMRDQGDEEKIDTEEAALDFLGPQLDAAVVEQLVTGLLNPRSIAVTPISTLICTAAADTCADTGVNPAVRDDVGQSAPVTTPVAADMESLLFGGLDEGPAWRDQYPHTPPCAPPRATEASANAAGPHRIVWTSPSARPPAGARAGDADAADAAAAREQVAHPSRAAKRSYGRPARAGKTATRGAASTTSHASATHATMQFTSALLSEDLEPLHRRVKPRLAVPLLPKRHFDSAQEYIADEFGGIGGTDARNETVAQTPFFVRDDPALLRTPTQEDEFLESYMDDIAADEDEEALPHDTLEVGQGLARFQDAQFLATSQNRFFLSAPNEPGPAHSYLAAARGESRWAEPFCAAPRTPGLWNTRGCADRHATVAARTGQGYSWKPSFSLAGLLWESEAPLFHPSVERIVSYEEVAHTRPCF
jgi:exonuclease-1